MPPSTAPPSPTVTCSTFTSPLMTPSIWISPPPEMSPSNVMSAPISEAPRCGRTADRGASARAASGAAAPCVAGCGVEGVAGAAPGCWGLEPGLLNIVAGLYETEGVLGAAVHPHLVVKVGAR